MRYEIFQLKNVSECRYAFQPLDKAIFKLEDYEKVYEGEMLEMSVGDALEELWRVFNVSKPEDFKGHSMSVSDLVVVEGKMFYVNDLGWEYIEK